MAIFKKTSPLEGNPCKSNGVSIEFKGMYYETDDEDEIDFLSQFKCYTQAEETELITKEEAEEAEKPVIKAATGVISASKLAGIAAQNK